MQIFVSGKQLDVGDVLQSHVDERLQSRITNDFSNSMDADVVFSKEGHDSRTDLLAHFGQPVITFDMSAGGRLSTNECNGIALFCA